MIHLEDTNMDMIQIKHEIEALTDAHREEFEALFDK